MPTTLDVTLFTDPGCPWGYSATPDLTVLAWRYGAQLRWRTVMIGLAETPDRYLDAGYTPAGMVASNRVFRDRFGMPFQSSPRERIVATGRACRAIVAAGRLAPGRQRAVLRALQFAWFTTDLLLDEDPAIERALAQVEDLDVSALMAALDDPGNEAAYQDDRALTRSAAGGATEFQGKSANSDGAERYTAPSLLFTAADGRTLEAGGFQSLAVYDACVANLDRSLTRRAPAASAAEVVEQIPDGVTTQEVAAVMASGLDVPDRAAAEAELLELTVTGRVHRTPLGDDALWRPAAQSR